MTIDLEDKIYGELSELQLFFTDALNNLANGKIVDMTGIDKRVAQVCISVQTAPPEKQQEYLPNLSSLIEMLGAYERDLRKIQEILDKKPS